jgi:hypothetical protein
MASYFPPTENLPIFDNEVFDASNSDVLTIAKANLLYLRKTVADTATAIETFNAGIKTNSVAQRTNTTLFIGDGINPISLDGSIVNMGDGAGDIVIQGTLKIPSISDSNYIMRVPSSTQSIPNNTETPVLFTGLISAGNLVGLGYNISTGVFTNLNTLSTLTCQITYNVSFSSNATGVRYAKITSSAATPTNTSLSTINALPSPFTSNIVGASILVIPPLGTFKVMCYQNSTLALNLDFTTTSIQVLIF